MSVISHPKVKGGEMRDEREDKSYLYSSVGGGGQEGAAMFILQHINVKALKKKKKKSLNSTHKENIYPFSKVS